MFKLLSKLYFYKFSYERFDNYYSRIIVRLFNHFLPIYFNLTASFPQNKLDEKNVMGDEKYIVSLTTFPARIEKVWLTIESILRQNDKPDKVMLWLYKGEFNGKNSLPKKLQNLEKRGLEIRFCDENLMPHKKYFYTMQEFPEANVITIDDDFFYPFDLMERLKKFHKKYFKSIICPITRKIEISNDEILPYKKWNIMKRNSEPSFLNLTMGGGGTLFPSHSLHSDAFKLDEIKALALKTDDLWLKVMSLRKKTKVVSAAGEFNRFFIPIINKTNFRLMDENIGNGENDKTFKNLLSKYAIYTQNLK